jgi:hypothetical protein
VLLLLTPHGAVAQPARPGDLAGVILGPDDRYASHLAVARERIARKDWAVAVTLLQKLLDLPGERFAVVKEDGKETVVNLRRAAERLLAGLPKEGRTYYENEVGPPAAELLKKARTLNEPAMLAEVIHRYLLTEAGLEAAQRLGAHYVDAGRLRQGAVVYDALDRRLLAGPLRKLDAATLYKAARAYHGAGDDARVAELLVSLEKMLGSEELKVGKRTLTIADIKKELKPQPRKAPAGLAHWPMFRGDASRSAQGVGGTAFLEPRWKFATWREQFTKNHLDKAVEMLAARKRTVLPALYPLSATLARKDGKVPLMVYRDFWGIHARPLRNVGKDPKAAEFVKAGDIYWEDPSMWSIDRMSREPRHVQYITTWVQTYLNSGLRPEALFENSVVGSLSTDNVRVYTIDDFQVTPYQQPFNRFNRPGGGVPAGDAKLNDALHHNVLEAYALDSGKLLWQVGGRGSKAPNDLRDTFFLAPPLLLDGKLLVPVEKKGELHVVTLQPDTGKVLGWLRLAAVREKMADHPLRRSHATHLAYAEGVLVCPTNAGAILGVDLKAHSVLWAHGYRERNLSPAVPLPDRFGRIPPPGMTYTEDGRLVPLPVTSPSWSASAPILRDGKVVFTAPDSAAVHCLQLRNGQLLWRHPRLDGDLYLGGVFDGKVLIVGSKGCRALDLGSGKVVWALDTGLPSGMGIAAGNRYFLPLKAAIKTRQPEICIIDIAKGEILAHTRSRRQEVPGNLLLFEDSVLSLSLTEVAAYPQLAAEVKRIDALLLRNTKDAVARTARGNLRQSTGDLAGSILDFRAALRAKPDEATADKARAGLYESLTEYFRRDFDAAEKYLADFEEACRLKVPEGAGGKERQRLRVEQARRLTTYYAVLGQGRERQKKFVEAAKAYLDLLEQGRVHGLMEVPGDAALKVTPAVWVRGRLRALLEKATPQEREQIDKEIEKRLKKGKQKADADSLRRMLTVAGVASAAGRAARAELAKRLTAKGDLLGAERLLLELRRQRHDLPAAARAVEALALLCLRQGLTDDAMFFYRELDRHFGRVIVRDGKTGSQLFEAIASDKRFLTALDGPPRFPSGVPFGLGREKHGNFPLTGLLFELEQRGERLPHFQRYATCLRPDYNQFKVFDREKMDDPRYDGEYSKTLESVSVQQLLQARLQGNPTETRQRCYNLGHLVILPVGHKVFAFDPVKKRLLWEINPTDARGQPPVHSITVDPQGGMEIVYADGWRQRLGLPGLVTPDAVVMQTPEGLIAVDPLSGERLWSRSDLPRRADVFGDGQHLFVVGLDSEGVPQTSQALRVADGTTVRVPPFAALYRQRRHLFRGTLVLADTGDKGAVVLRQYDLLSGKDLCKKTFAPKALVLESVSEDLAGAVEPDGTVTVVELPLHQTVLTAKMKAEHLAGVKKVRLLSDARSIYLACEGPPDQRILGPVIPSLMPGRGFRTIPVNGMLYRFDAGGRGREWFTEGNNQMLLLNRLEETPVLLLTARYARKQLGRDDPAFVTVIRAYDKATGKIIYDKEDTTNSIQPFHTLRVDPAKGVIELVSYTMKVVFEPRRTPPK